MRLMLIGAVAASATMAGMALGQVTSVRPTRLVQVPVEQATLADVQHQVVTLAAQVAQDHQQIAALTTQVQKQQQLIGDMQIGLKSTTVRGFDTAGQVTAITGQLTSLKSAFGSHSHFYTFATQSGNKQMLNTTQTTAPSQYCVKVGGGGQAIDQYKCSAP